MLGDRDDDLLSLLGRLIERMRRSLSVKHLVQSEHGLQIADQAVRARIGWDETKDGGSESVMDDRVRRLRHGQPRCSGGTTARRLPSKLTPLRPEIVR